MDLFFINKHCLLLAGDWLISILYEGQHIQGSPFNVRVYDAAQVKVFGLEGGSVGKDFSFSSKLSSLLCNSVSNSSYYICMYDCNWMQHFFLVIGT